MAKGSAILQNLQLYVLFGGLKKKLIITAFFRLNI
jgi:hypothetical protein